MMPRNRKITISTTIVVGSVLAALAMYGQMDNGFSLTIKTKGRIACRNQMPCVFSLGEIFPGDWDRVLIFNIGASQKEIDKAIHHHVEKPDSQRLVVFMQGSNVTRTLTESEVVKHPDPATVFFDRVPQTHSHQIVQRDWSFVMVAGGLGHEDCIALSRIMPGEHVE
jgi:hypothetical protein